MQRVAENESAIAEIVETERDGACDSDGKEQSGGRSFPEASLVKSPEQRNVDSKRRQRRGDEGKQRFPSGAQNQPEYFQRVHDGAEMRTAIVVLVDGLDGKLFQVPASNMKKHVAFKFEAFS